MRGHVRKRGTLWAVVVDLPRDPTSGKRKQRWHSGFKTRKEAERALADVLSRLDQGTYAEPTKKTFAMFLDEWLVATRSTIRPATYATYESITKKHIVPRLGSLPLQGITAATLNALYADLLASGRRDGKGGLSPATVRYVHAVIRKALADAVRWNLLTRNVADAADHPGKRHGRSRLGARVRCARFSITCQMIRSTPRTSLLRRRGCGGGRFLVCAGRTSTSR